MNLISIFKENPIPCLITAIVYCGNAPWFLWKYGAFIGFFLSIILLISIRNKLPNVSANIWMFILFFLFPIFILIPFFRGMHFSSWIYIIIFLCTFCISDNQFIKALKYITNILSYIILISLPLWLIHIFVAPLPLYDVYDFSQAKGADNVIMNNYFFFVMNTGTIANRFYSVFDEPGVLGTFSAFVLFGNSYKMNWKTIVILIGGFFTYSMAFYVLTMLGILITYWRRPAVLLRITIPIAIIGCMGFLYLKNDLAFQQAVLYRITGNKISDLVESRNAYEVNQYYDKISDNEQILFGVGFDKMTNLGLFNGASYKHFIIEYGLIGLFTIALMYFLMLRKRYDFYTWGTYIMFAASFTQRPLLWSSWQIILFSCLIANVYKRRKKLTVNTEY